MGDPLVGKTIEIGNKPRTLKFDMKALRIAQKRFKGTPVRELLQQLDVDVVCELAACGLVHEDRTISADRVEGWLEAEPKKYVALQDAVFDGISEAYARMRPESKQLGEARAPALTAGATTEAGPTSLG